MLYRNPERTLDSEFFWQGIDRGEFLIQRCDSCGQDRHPPSPQCAHCHSTAWKAVSYPTTATVYSFTVVHSPALSGMPTPFVVVLLEWPTGIRFLTDLPEVQPSEVSVGMLVSLRFVEVEEGVTLPIGFLDDDMVVA
jgi:uncharacterized protein